MAGTATNGLDLSGLKIKDLKTLIETGALQHKDCLDRADLERRASEAVAQTCSFVATLDLRRLEVAAKVWLARRKQDSDYDSDCSDESGPPGLDTGLDDDDDGPPGLEEDAPPGGSAGGSAGGSDSEDSDYDSDDSDDSGPPGLEDEEERERAERAARKKAAAAPAPAPAPPLSKSQAKAAKAKRQKMRKQAAFADTLKKGSKVFVTKKGVETIATVVKIHRDDPEELYVTVRDASGQERQTLLSYCREAKGAKALKAERAARVKAAADAAEQKLRAEEEQERELEKLANALGNKPLVKDKKKPKKKPPPPPRAKENNGAKDGAPASETKKGKGGATGAKDAAAASKTKKGKK